MRKSALLSLLFLSAACIEQAQIEPGTASTTIFTGKMAEDSKLYLDSESYQVKFSKNDQFMTWAVQGTNKFAKSIYVLSESGTEPVSFSSASYDGIAESQTYYLAGTYMGTNGTTYPSLDMSKPRVTWVLPETQTIKKDSGPVSVYTKSGTTYTKSCIILYAQTETFPKPQKEVSLHFKHTLAYAKMTLKNLALEKGETVSTIALSSPSKALRSNIYYNPSDGSISTASGTYKNLNLNVTDLDTGSGSFDVLFVLPPADLSGTGLSLKTTTSASRVIDGTITIPAGKGKFQCGHLLPFVINCKNFKQEEFESAASAVRNMKVGWNCGNSLDSHGIACINNTKLRCGGDKLLGFETGWGNPKIKASLFPFVKQAGFDAVRLPVTWYPWMDEEGNVDKAWMDRVEEVVNYVLAADLYCILNVHHDAGSKDTRWLTCDPSTYAAVSARFKKLWTQIAERFGGYGPKLLFEGYNEILDASCNWDDTDAASYATANQLNQDFVDLVRASGGNNAERNLIVTTYSASAHKAPVEAFVLPKDSASGRLIVETHIYAPYRFCFDQEDPEQDWKVFDSKGEEEAKRYLKIFNDNIASKGIPCILGEFGARPKDNDVERAKLATCYVSTAKDYGMVSFIWNTLINGEDRNTPAWTAPLVKDAMLDAVK